MTILIDTAKSYLEAGLSVFPVKKDKTPSISCWTQYQKRRPTPAEIETMFADADATGVAIVGGRISGGLEVLDFDDGGSAFDGWKQKVPLGLYNRLTVERSPSGGCHVYYRCQTTEGRTVFSRYEGKKKITLIEIRGNKHYTVCAPSKGYELIQGNFYSIPEITPEERKTLIDAARSFDETPLKSSPTKTPTAAPLKAQSNPAMPAPADLRPGDDFNQKATMGSIRALLEDSGWTFHHADAERLHFTRPGKTPNEGESGNLKLENGVPIFYNHSSNALDVPSEQGLNPFSLFCRLRHADNAEAAASALRRDGYGGNRKDNNPVSSPAVPAVPADNAGEAGDDGESIHRDRESWVEFPLQCLPPMTRQWVTEKSKAMNVDPSYLAMSILTEASALIGAKYQIDLHRGDWRPFPVLWTFLVGNSSQKKSPCISSCLNMLIDKERELRNENAVALNEYAIKLSDYEAELKRRRKSTDEYELPEKPTRPPERVLTVTGDFTMNGLIKAASDNQWGFLIAADEITTILNAQIATKKGEPMLGELAKFYKGDSSQTRFKHNENNVYAERCLAAILTAGTPGNVRKLIAGTENATNGFVSRLLMIYPPMPEKFCRAGVSEDTAGNMKSIMEYLVELEPYGRDFTMRGMLGEEIQCVEYSPHTIHLDGREGVDSRWLEWQEDIFNKIKQSNDELEASLLGKSEELLPRLALLLNVLKGAERYVAEGEPEPQVIDYGYCISGTYIPRRVSQATWKEAEILTNWLIDESRAVHQILGLSATRNSNKDVMASIEKLVEGMQKKGVPEISVSHIGDYVSQARGKDAKAKNLINRIVAYAAKDKRFSIRQGEYNGRPVQYLKLLDR